MQPRDRNRRRPGTPLHQQAAGLLRPPRAEISPQQRELDQIGLRHAAADAFALIQHRRDRVDGGVEIPQPESIEARAIARE